MKKALIILNHNPAKELTEDLYKNYGVEEVATLKEVAPELSIKFSQIPVEYKTPYELQNYIINDIVRLVDDKGYDLVVVSGEPVTCKWLTITLEEGLGVKSYAPLSRRESVDVEQPDGSVVKKSVFKYAGLREF